MGYSSRGHKPFESASKAAHHHIINDPEVQSLLKQICRVPRSEEVSIDDVAVEYLRPKDNPIEAIIAVDGGYTEAIVDREFPSRLLHFLQFGALLFKRDDLL